MLHQDSGAYNFHCSRQTFIHARFTASNVAIVLLTRIPCSASNAEDPLPFSISSKISSSFKAGCLASSELSRTSSFSKLFIQSRSETMFT